MAKKKAARRKRAPIPKRRLVLAGVIDLGSGMTFKGANNFEVRSCAAIHSHPELKRRSDPLAFIREFWSMVRAAGLNPLGATLVWSQRLGDRHERNGRRYAEVLVREGTKRHPDVFYFAPQVLWLPRAHRRGLIAHEIGHAIVRRAGEGRADRAARDVLGVEIDYDHRWPGKGLEVAVPRRSRGTTAAGAVPRKKASRKKRRR